jgi:type IV pilus modification protein PilV
MMFVRKKSQAGFSMIELLVAVVILAVGLLGLAELQVTAIKANSQTNNISAATAIAQKTIERIAAMDPADAIFNADGTGNFSSVVVDGAGTYNIAWTVDEGFEGVTNLCKVTIVVESASDVMNVLGNQKRIVTASTLKRAI